MTSFSKNTAFNQLVNSPGFFVEYDLLASIEQEGLKLDDYVEICRRLKRPPNRNELGMFGVMWSEHCCYRNSRPLLKKFPTTGPRILVGPGENAGVVDIGFGQKLVFKIESHNHPSAVEPFQGAATGVGGILRDIFTMGARPIALLNALRFGPLENEKNISLLEGVVSGISHYGNCVGVPTVGGEVRFDNSYSGNPLVNAMALGLMETDEIVCSGASGIDFPVLYVGNTTGRDGMGGASFASSELSKTSIDDRPAVQVGDPFLEKGLIEACLEAFKTGYVIAAQDMGAAGLTCSCSEMASKGEVGIELNLDLVPAREKGMTAYEFLLSESQERMLFVIKPGSEQELKQLFMRWGLYVEVVGKVLKEKVVRVLHKGKIVANIPASALADDTPIEEHTLLNSVPEYLQEHWKWDEDLLPENLNNGIINLQNKVFISWNNVLLNLLSNPSIASKNWIYKQYDYQVQSNTVICPGEADAAVIRIRSQNNFKIKSKHNRGIASVVDCNDRWVYLDPKRGSMSAVAEAARNLSCVGAEPLAITNNLNFSSPENPVGFWQLSMSCEGITNACKVLDTPVTGGNVSLYNDTKLPNNAVIPIHPTPVIGMVGLIDNLNNLCKKAWLKTNDQIFIIGLPLETKKNKDNRISLSASSFLEYIHGLKTGRPPEIDLNLEKQVNLFLRKIIKKGIINSAHDVANGGLSVAIAECCIASGFGAKIILPESDSRLDRTLFAEGGSRVLISCSDYQATELKKYYNNFILQESNIFSLSYIGNVNNQKKLSIYQSKNLIVDINIQDLQDKYKNTIQKKVSN
ncbi:phosphoribosylformylglycinamidine synthase subunit PurL [Prochlorococcus marinus]|uniref:Phosphoribosylformylglycinamidine synthase subunit PurL n=1 Tax=Prochlorococcus marinus XMU1408 TaxID=2213228 RepID=A0A318RIA5_PROMR|nr:phosphoribosylformylglycinamidine synthase subunit PurL [Prochlorococcus marinus]MBW3042982.1 phosphoribosylformylglycinamidine synthase subunit PurL [Prochlorococcus marinus str. XMU1408]PYE03612.1 phosphoribosylformylglycinamidine synthase subunit PurL [Prochlorococcus marinus XMU1408]